MQVRWRRDGLGKVRKQPRQGEFNKLMVFRGRSSCLAPSWGISAQPLSGLSSTSLCEVGGGETPQRRQPISEIPRASLSAGPSSAVNLVGGARMDLFRREITLFRRDTGVFRREITLFRRDTGVFRRKITLFRRDTGVFRREMTLFCSNIGLFLRQTIQLCASSSTSCSWLKCHF